MAKIEKRTYKSFKVSVSSDEARRITALRSDPATADAWHDVPVRMTVIVGLREHDLRHESTSRLFEQTTLRAVEIGHMTGHSDPRMLQRYNNLRPREFVEMFKQARRIRQPDAS